VLAKAAGSDEPYFCAIRGILGMLALQTKQAKQALR